jgi:hypothetical protein
VTYPHKKDYEPYVVGQVKADTREALQSSIQKQQAKADGVAAAIKEAEAAAEQQVCSSAHVCACVCVCVWYGVPVFFWACVFVGNRVACSPVWIWASQLMGQD